MIFKQNYRKYGKEAPLIRNKLIIENVDMVIAIWNGINRETKFAMDYARKIDKKLKIFLLDVIGIEIIPGNMGKECPSNGEHGFFICCDECDYLMCCINSQYPSICEDCIDGYCPRKINN